MKYQELLERFWDLNRDFSDKETILYFYLLHRCNSLGWPDTFSLSNDELIERLRCRPHTMMEARKALIDSGLITYQSGNGRRNNSFYSIVAEKSKKGAISDYLFEEKGCNLGLPFSDKGCNLGLPFSDTTVSKSSETNSDESKKGAIWDYLFEDLKETTKEKKTIPPAPPIKEKKEKKKTGLTQSRTYVREDGQFVLFKEDVPIRKKRNPIEPNLPKDMDEVIRFFEKNAADKLTDWKAEAELFFYHFDSLGWMGTSNRKIQDWESRAYLWISDKALKNGEQERRQTEIDARNLRPFGRTAGIPQGGERGKEKTQGRGSETGRTDDAPKDYTKGF